jgi:hypothetical protein
MQLSARDEIKLERWNIILQNIDDFITAPAASIKLKVSKDTIRKVLNDLAALGYVACEKRNIIGGCANFYKPVKREFDINDYTPFETRAKESYIRKPMETVGVLPNARQIWLTDTRHPTPATRQRRSAWLGTTLGTMTF